MQLLEESFVDLQVNPLYIRLACWHTSVSHIVKSDASLMKDGHIYYSILSKFDLIQWPVIGVISTCTFKIPLGYFAFLINNFQLLPPPPPFPLKRYLNTYIFNILLQQLI